MARWSNAMKFDKDTLKLYKTYLDRPGIYELGFVRGPTFYWKYVGKASKSLYRRLRCYHQPSPEEEIPPQLWEQLYNQRNLVWFHVLTTDDPFQSEQMLLHRLRTSKDGDYSWNRKNG